MGDGAGEAEIESSPSSPPTPLAARAVRRALADREATAYQEVQLLLDSALTVMRANGPNPPRVADIVATAGLSNQTFYRHFAGRDELVAAVVEAGALRLVGYLAHRIDKVPADDPGGRIAAWVEGVLAQASNPAVADVTRSVLWNLHQLPRRHGDPANVPGLVDLLLGPLADAGSSDPDRDAATIVGTVFSRLEQFLWVVPLTEDDVEHLVGFCLRAVRA